MWVVWAAACGCGCLVKVEGVVSRDDTAATPVWNTCAMVFTKARRLYIRGVFSRKIKHLPPSSLPPSTSLYTPPHRSKTTSGARAHINPLAAAARRECVRSHTNLRKASSSFLRLPDRAESPSWMEAGGGTTAATP